MQQNKIVMIRMAVYCFVFVASAMGAMLYYSANKVIVVTDVAQDEVAASFESGVPAGEAAAAGSTGGNAAAGNEAAVEDTDRLNIDRSNQNTNYFCIPLPADVRAEEVVIENHYMDRELWVSIESQKPSRLEDFYAENSAYGNCENVLDGHYDLEDHRMCLRFEVTDVYEYHSIFEDNTLYVEFAAPKEVYDKIVVVDPAYGDLDMGVTADGVNGKDITLEIAKALKARLDETDIKVYYTRMDDTDPDASERVKLAAATKADMLIRIEVGGDDNSKQYGTEAVYNSRFFIPGFGSIELADLLEREVVTAISGKANGLLEAGEEDAVIRDATVPAAAVKVGYLTNGQEQILLRREDYIDRIAEGIYQTIVKAYEEQGR